MSKRKSYNFIIELGVYPLDIMFSFAQTDKQFLKSADDFIDIEFYKKDLEDLIGWGEVQTGIYMILPCNQSFVKLKEIPVCPKYKAVLSHEIFHAVFAIMDRVGMKPSYDSWEAYAYAIQYLTQQVYDHIK